MFSDRHQRAINHLVSASLAAQKGKHDEAAKHIESAKTWAGMNEKTLRDAGRHDEAAQSLDVGHIQN